MHKYIALDVEATGVDFEKGQVLQCAAYFLNDDLSIIKSYSWNVNYKEELFYWCKEAEEVHKIKKEGAISHGVDPEVFLKEFENEIIKAYGINADEIHIIAANAYFDYLMLKNLWDKYRGKDEFPLSRRVMDITAISLFVLGVAGLSKTTEALGIEVDDDRKHDATYDAYLHLQVFKGLIDRAKTNGIDIWKKVM